MKNNIEKSTMELMDFKYLSFCLYLLRIGKSGDTWRVAYGIITPTQEKMETPVVSGSSQIGSCSKGKMSIRKVVWAADQDIIMGLFDDLAHGVSLKTSLDVLDVNTDNYDFDVDYTQDAVDVPWGAENILTSQLSYTKSISLLDPSQLFMKDGDVPKDLDKALEVLETYLKKQTKLPFGNSFDHVGNLDIIVSPDRDALGKPLVENHWKKGNPFVQQVVLHKELIKKDDELLINLVRKENGKIVGDTIEKLLVSEIHDVERNYPIDECPDSLEVKIWRLRGGNSVVISDTFHCFLKHISISIGMLEGGMRINTQWLREIRENLPEKKRGEVDKAIMIDRSEMINAEIGEPVQKRTQRKINVKGNDEFFPKGWNAEEDQHGLLSFLAWFKKKAKGAKSIFLQDPYFEDVAMYFFASADISSEYTVLTQTKLKTNPDGTVKIEEDETEGDDRKMRILEGIKANPRMFDPMKLVIIDIPIKHNVLHDRYLVFDFGNGKVEGYTLSNSLQGATNKQPLLVTQIGDAAFAKVNDYIKETMNRDGVETIYNYSNESGSVRGKEEIDKVADGDFLKTLDEQKDDLKKGHVNKVLNEIRTDKTNERIATFGYFLATIYDTEAFVIIDHVTEAMRKDKDWAAVIKDFILDTYNTCYPIGYVNCPFRGRVFYDPTCFLGMGYNQIVTSHNTNLLDCIGGESHTYGVYGHYYMAKLLLRLSVNDFVDLLKQLKAKLLAITTDKTATPCYKVTVMLMIELLESDFWQKSDSVMRVLLTDTDEWCRGVGTLLFLQKAKEDDFDCEKYRELLNNENELVSLCHAAWGMKPAPVHRDVFYKWLVDVYSNKKEKIYFNKRLFEEILGETHFVEDKLDYLQNVVIPMIDMGLVERNELSKDLIERLYDACVNGRHTIMMRDVLPECLFIIKGDLSLLYDKSKKTLDESKENLKRIPLKSEDNIFESFKECIELRVVLLRMVEKYKDLKNDTIENIKVLLHEIDKTLDDYGLERVKRTFENLK